MSCGIKDSRGLAEQSSACPAERVPQELLNALRSQDLVEVSKSMVKSELLVNILRNLANTKYSRDMAEQSSACPAESLILQNSRTFGSTSLRFRETRGALLHTVRRKIAVRNPMRDLDLSCFIFILIIIFSLAIRLIGASTRALSFDEGIHSYFSYLLYSTGEYVYDPYIHGPFLYYVTAAMFHILGDNVFVAKLMPAFFGTGTIALLWFLRPWLGDARVLASSFLLACSPIFIAYSRDVHNDPFLVFFSLLLVICTIKYVSSKNYWYLLGGSASAALMFTVKENAYITALIFISFGLAAALLSGSMRRRRGVLPDLKAKWLHLAAGAVVFICVYALFFTSFLSHPEGLTGSVVDMADYWLGSLFHEYYAPETYHPWYSAILALANYEFAVLSLGLAGGAYYLYHRGSILMVFFSYWALASLIIYSMMEYKTGQLLLHILLPLSVVAGCFAVELYESLRLKRGSWKPLGRGCLYIALAFMLILFFQSYVFAYTEVVVGLASDEARGEFDELGALASELTSTGDRQLVILLPDSAGFPNSYPYWPLPWYVRELRSVNVNIDMVSNLDLDNVVKKYPDSVLVLPVSDFSLNNGYPYLNNSGYISRRFNTTISNRLLGIDGLMLYY